MTTTSGPTPAAGTEVRQWVDDLRRKLDIVDAETRDEGADMDAARAVEEAISTVRASVWDLLTGQHSDDYPAFLGRTRVRRATELCEEILADLHADTLLPSAPGMPVFQANLRELSRALRAYAPVPLQREVGDGDE